MKKEKAKRKKPQRDVNQMAYDIVRTIQISDTDAAKALGRKGGLARKAKQSKERLSEIGTAGADARWHKDKDKTVVPAAEKQ